MRPLIFASLLLLLGSHAAGAETPDAQLEAGEALGQLMKCRAEPSPLVRLDCYDRTLLPVGSPTGDELAQTGPAWQRAMAQEQARGDHSTAFLITVTEGDNPTVVMTTPAIGLPPPRPVLMLSCQDNITRLQVALVTPRKEDDGMVMLATEKTRFNAHWFLRESGYLLESSRGLSGIDEIKRLSGAESLTIGGQNGAVGSLRFSIAGLDEAIKPLRAACHW